MADRGLSISARDVAAIAAAVESEVTGVGAGGIGNVNAVVDAIVGRAAMGLNDGVGGWGRSIQGAINEAGQFEGIGKAGGWQSYAKHNAPDKATIDAVKTRLGEIAQVGQVPLAPDFGNPAKSSWARSLETKTAALPAPGGTHVYGVAPTTKDALTAAGITGPGLAVNLSFGKGLNISAPSYDTPSEKTGKGRVAVDPALAGLLGQEPTAPDLPGKLSPDLNDVPQLENQVTKPDLPGALTLGSLDDVKVSVPGAPDPADTMPGPSYPDITASLYGEYTAPAAPATPDPMTTMAGPTYPDITQDMYAAPAVSDISVPQNPDVGQVDLSAYGPNINEQEQGGFGIGTGPTPEDAAREAQVSHAMQAVSDPITSYSYDSVAHGVMGNVMGELSPTSARNPDVAAQHDYQARQAEYSKAVAEYDKQMAAYEAATKNFEATPVGAKVTDTIPGVTAPGIGASGLAAFGFGAFGQPATATSSPAKQAARPTPPEKPVAPTPPTAPAAPKATAAPASRLSNVSVEDEMGGYSKAATNQGPYTGFANATEAMSAIGAGQAPAPTGVSAYDARTAFGDSVYAGSSYNAVMDAVANQGGFVARKGIGEGFMDDVGIPKEYQGTITDGLMGAAKGAVTGGLPGAVVGGVMGATGWDKKVDEALGIDKLENRVNAALGLDKAPAAIGGFLDGLFNGKTSTTTSGGEGGSSYAGYDTNAKVGQGGLADVGSYGIQGMDGTFDSGLSPSRDGSFGGDPSQDGGARYS